MPEKPATTPIPVQLSGSEFRQFILPHLSMPKRGPRCKLGYHRVFNLYADGASERIVGKALKRNGQRHQVILSTKMHYPIGPGPNDSGNSRLHILRACDRRVPPGSAVANFFNSAAWMKRQPVE